MGRAQYTVAGDIAICSILFKGNLVEFLIDAADLERVRPHKWHLSNGTYIATSVRHTATDSSGTALKREELYLHTFLANPPPGHVVMHLTKNGLDNRRANLRVVPAATAATLQSTSKKRTTELPALCGITPADIPKHVWYVQANGYHRDRFAIEIKTEGILWKSTSSKKISLQEKLQQTKDKLQQIYTAHPHLDPAKEEALIHTLTTSFEATLAQSSANSTPSPNSTSSGEGYSA